MHDIPTCTGSKAHTLLQCVLGVRGTVEVLGAIGQAQQGPPHLDESMSEHAMHAITGDSPVLHQ